MAKMSMSQAAAPRDFFGRKGAPMCPQPLPCDLQVLSGEQLPPRRAQDEVLRAQVKPPGRTEHREPFGRIGPAEQHPGRDEAAQGPDDVK